MTESTPIKSLLIATSDRQDRKDLFDALDSDTFEAIYSARDIEQALHSVEQDSDINVVFLELTHSQEIDFFCQKLSQLPHANDVKIVGLVAEHSSEAWEKRPKQIQELIRAPIQAQEVHFRLQKLFGTEIEPGDEAELIFEASPVPLLARETSYGNIIAANTELSRLTGYKSKQLLENTLDILEVEGEPGANAVRQEELVQNGACSYETHYRRKNGGLIPVQVESRLGVFGGQPAWISSVQDRSDLKFQRRALDMLSRAFSGDASAHSLSELVDDFAQWLHLDYFLITQFSTDDEDSALHPLAAFARGELKKVPTTIGGIPDKRLRRGRSLLLPSQAFKKLTVDPFTVSNRFESYLALPLNDSAGALIGAAVIASKKVLPHFDIVEKALRILCTRFAMQLELREFREQSDAKGFHDNLTKLPNRLLFNDRLEQALRDSHDNAELFALLFVDLDRFKNINDSLGHQVGDLVLTSVAERLNACVRPQDTVARYAGDEFTVLLRGLNARQQADEIAQNMSEKLGEPLHLDDGEELRITASIGLSMYPEDGSSADQLLKHADTAMYSAKGLGRNTVQSYISNSPESNEQRIMLESKLRNAEQNGELRVFYQPQLNVETEDIVGMEALIRWEHPELGLISPGFFIPIAEETGLIVSIGEWVLREACKQTKIWQDKFNLPLRVGVNFSAIQLKQPGLVEQVSHVLHTTELPPETLDLEVTESINARQIPDLMEIMTGLRDTGAQISIDDFGTGQSSLDYIKRFPAQRIKIDQSFVKNIGIDPDDEAIVEATMAMAHNLHRSVIAEGVEEEDHLEFLARLGCEEVQGFLFCRPLPQKDFEELLTERAQLLSR